MQELNSIMRDLLEVEYNQESLKKQRLVKKGCMIMDRRSEWKLNDLPDFEKKDAYKSVY